MTRRYACLLLLLTCLPLAGCNRDAEVNSTLSELDTFTTELVKKVEAAPNPSAGIDDAQKYFDSRKADLTAKMQTLKGLRGYQVSDETKKKLTESMIGSAKRVAGLQMKYVAVSVRDPQFKAKLDKLTKDFQGLFTV